MVNKRWGANISNIVAVFTGDPKRENPVMTTNTDTAKRKENSQHMLREEKLTRENNQQRLEG